MGDASVLGPCGDGHRHRGLGHAHLLTGDREGLGPVGEDVRREPLGGLGVGPDLGGLPLGVDADDVERVPLGLGVVLVTQGVLVEGEGTGVLGHAIQRGPPEQDLGGLSPGLAGLGDGTEDDGLRLGGLGLGVGGGLGGLGGLGHALGAHRGVSAVTPNP